MSPEHKHREPHATRPVQVWADVDLGIADMVAYLNTVPGVRTMSSCQGTLGEGGPAPYGPYVMASWSEEIFEFLTTEFEVDVLGERWGYIRPKGSERGELLGPNEQRRVG